MTVIRSTNTWLRSTGSPYLEPCGRVWTLGPRGIRAQALTPTKSHERIGPLTGIANSAKLYGFDDPLVGFSDDLIKDKHLVDSAFHTIFIIPVGTATCFAAICLKLPKVHRFKILPTSLLRLLINDRVFKIGSRIKGDLIRLQKQFAVLRDKSTFNVIDLKEYSIQRGAIGRKDAG
ncbi:hypothetical protein C8R45DRAFT_931274 [Mycena sanguinolenta]|nr:hypothetical protein C8R45DRAFT_931274 [Mycena sanguinolenta]